MVEPAYFKNGTYSANLDELSAYELKELITKIINHILEID